VNDDLDLERLWKEAVWRNIKALSFDSPGGTDENHKIVRVHDLLDEI
jgi:hypothetical protein